jgi:uncharacterized protein YeeX (DUF496 family)
MMQEFDWWSLALTGEKVEINADAPQSGFYKMRRVKDGPWLPVMIRMQDGVLRCRVGSNSDEDPHEVWTHCAKNPVTKAAVAYAFKHGNWEGDDPTIGDNSKEVSLLEQLNEYVSASLAWLKGRKIEDKKTADQAANRRAEVLRLKGLVEKEWDAKALPHDTVLKALKQDYSEPVKQADLVNAELRKAATEFAKAEEKRLQDEANAKHEAERKAAAADAKAVLEQRAKQVADDPVAALTSPEPELPMAPPPPAPVKVALGGQVGKVSGLRSYWEAEVTDQTAALTHYANHPDVVALILKLAKADSKASKGTANIPGVRCFEDRRVA